MFDNYAYYPELFIPLSKGRKSDGAEKNINNLNQVLPNPSEWQELLSKDKNKLSICKLLAEFFVSGEVYTEKKHFCNKRKEMFCKVCKPSIHRKA